MARSLGVDFERTPVWPKDWRLGVAHQFELKQATICILEKHDVQKVSV